MNHARLFLIFIIAVLVGFQSVDNYTENSLKESEIEKSVLDEYVVSLSFKEFKKSKEVLVFRSVKQYAIVENPTTEVVNRGALFLKHRSLVI